MAKNSKKATHPDQSSTLIEIALEIRDPAKWAALMICKDGSGATTVGEAMDIIERIVRKAIENAIRNKEQGRNA